jgi:hypothetical protein
MHTSIYFVKDFVKELVYTDHTKLRINVVYRACGGYPFKKLQRGHLTIYGGLPEAEEVDLGRR